MACIAAVAGTPESSVGTSPGRGARWPQAVRGPGPRVAAGGPWGEQAPVPPNSNGGPQANNRYTVDIWQQNLQDQGGLSPSPSPRTTAVASASLDPLSLEAFLCGNPQQQQQQQQATSPSQQQQQQQNAGLQQQPINQTQQLGQSPPSTPQQPKLGCVTSITSPLKLLNNNTHGSYRQGTPSLSPRHLHPSAPSGLGGQGCLSQQQQPGSVDTRCSPNNNNQGEVNVMSEVSMMPLSLAPKRPAEEVHLTDSAAGLQRNAAKLLQSYKSRREDSVGGSDPSSSPHPEDSELDDEVDMPAIDSHQPFPCVWLDSSNGLPLTISPIEPDSKYVVIQPTDPGTAEDNGQDSNRTENAEKPAPEQTPAPETPSAKTEAGPPSSENTHVTNGHYPEEGSEADPAPPTNNGSTPPPISKTASVADALGTPLRSPGLANSQPATPTQSMANIANNMGQSIFPLSEGQTAGSPLMNSKMLSNVCNKVLSDVQGMNGLRASTTTIDENGENLEVCPECHKVFKRKVYLQRHMEREHWSTAKVFKCDDCSYETKHQSNLSVHRRIHTGERPYHCGACGQRYTQGHLLKSHIRSRHGGNMELYNLEKKSDSTRGRKSLDAKHDASPFIKQEKINSLVQQLEHQKLQHMMASPTMSHFMNNMSYINHLRPLMTNPLALSNNLLAGGTPNPRMLLGNMQNGLNNSMMSLQQNLNLMVNGSFMNPTQPSMSPVYTSSPTSTSATPTEANGIKLPLKIPEMQQAQNGNIGHQRTPTNLSFGSSSPQSTSATSMDWQDQNGPQDLTVRKASSQAASQISPSSRSSQSSLSYQPAMNGTATEGSTGSQRDSPVPDDLKSLQAEVSKGLKRPCEDPCEDENCAHAKKLKLLRKNIVRMLSVLTPDLSMDAGLNYDSDQVDELLHEVIYSNMEDIMEESTRKT